MLGLNLENISWETAIVSTFFWLILQALVIIYLKFQDHLLGLGIVGRWIIKRKKKVFNNKVEKGRITTKEYANNMSELYERELLNFCYRNKDSGDELGAVSIVGEMYVFMLVWGDVWARRISPSQLIDHLRQIGKHYNRPIYMTLSGAEHIQRRAITKHQPIEKFMTETLGFLKEEQDIVLGFLKNDNQD